MTSDHDLVVRAAAFIEACRARKLTLATAESCTGGMVAALLTEVPGASEVLERGYVTYSNRAKTELLGVPESLIAAHGAVSAHVAAAMAEGARAAASVDLAVAVTGIAGPGGGTPQKPVGLVYLACARRPEGALFSPQGVGVKDARRLMLGDVGRAEVRTRATEAALVMLEAAVQWFDADG